MFQSLLASRDDSNIKRAIEWMIYYDIRGEFPLERPLCHILHHRELHLLEPFIGAPPSTLRRESAITYIDSLLGLALQHSIQPVQQSRRWEQRLVEQCHEDTKTWLERPLARLLKGSPLPDAKVPSFVRARGRNLLLYYHKRWAEKGEIDRENYEENAMQAMSDDSYLRDYYLSYLCANNFHEQAINFSLALGMAVGVDGPAALKKYCEEHPEKVGERRKELEDVGKGGGEKKEADGVAEDAGDSRFELVSGRGSYGLFKNHF